MTEEMKTCDFYNEKICTLFSKYFGFNVECENVFLSTIDCDIERECPIKRLEQERDEWKKKYEDVANENLKEIYELIKKNDCWRGVVNVVCGKLEQENKELRAEIDDLLEKKPDCNDEFGCQELIEMKQKIKEVLK